MAAPAREETNTWLSKRALFCTWRLSHTRTRSLPRAARMDREARALDVCEIKVSTSAESTLDIWIYRTETNSNGDEPGLVTRGRLITGGDVVEPDHSELLRNQGSSKL